MVWTFIQIASLVAIVGLVVYIGVSGPEVAADAKGRTSK